MARKVYKRNGIIHCCFKGRHYAYPDTDGNVPEKVSVIHESSKLMVNGREVDNLEVHSSELRHPPAWILVMGFPGKWGQPAKKWRLVDVDAHKKPRPTRTQKTQKPSKQKVVEPIPQLEKDTSGVDERLVSVAPSDPELGILRACWDNWQRAKHLDLLQRYTYIDEFATERIRQLGRELMSEFR